MEEFEERLASLEKGLNDLVDRNIRFREENEKLREENEDLNNRIKIKENQINELRKHITLLKVSSSVHSISGPEEDTFSKVMCFLSSFI
jgi:chromosome segregation ATPase